MNDIIVFQYQAIFGVGGLLILLIGLAFYFSQKITVPIRQLVYSAQDIGDGLLDAPIRINTNDEIGILADELEQMRLNLLDFYENLEKKVDVRTNELKKVQFQIAHQEKMASIGLLAAGIAHEIGNPLTSISSITQLLNRRLKDEKNLDYLSTIMNNINRISNIVRELVDFSRPSNFEANLTNINEIVRAAVGIVKYDSRSKHIKFELNLQPELPRLVLVGDQLLQVFINILFNAVDAMEGFGDTLIVETVLKEHFIWILIKDSGRGISEADINKIFEPFYTTKEVGKGTGLGLSVSYGIVKNFHGNIDVESEVGKGSAFKIKLPIRNEDRE
jgi:signal transduction histidine kinase